MRSKTARYSFFLIHWVLAATIFILLGLGWYIEYMPSAPSRRFLLELHISLGLTSALLIFIQLCLQLIFKPPSSANEVPRLQALLANVLCALIYVSFVLILISGYLETVFSGMPIQFWGIPVPVWGVVDVTLATFFGTVHGAVAFILAGLIFVHVCVAAVNLFKRPQSASRTLPGAQESRELVPGEAKSIIASKMAQSLANNLRLFGWIAFWLQFVLAFISAPLLTFASSGRAFSPGSAGFGDAIYWGGYGFLLLCLAVLVAFYSTRAARKVVLRPDLYLSQKRSRLLWFLRTGVLIGFLGIFISFIGVGLSLSLLIAKTVSQPPGIAITDPNKIIRALDVFVLLVNCILLMAHFIGTSINLWLGIQAAKSRLEYKALR